MNVRDSSHLENWTTIFIKQQLPIPPPPERAGTERKGSTDTGLWQAGQCKTYMNGLCCSSACPSLSHIHWCGRGWVLECGAWRMGSGREQLLAANRQIWRGRNKEFHNQECLWKKSGPPEKQNAIAEWCTRGRAPTVPPAPVPCLGGH